MRVSTLSLLFLLTVLTTAQPKTVPVDIIEPVSYIVNGVSNSSILYQMILPNSTFRLPYEESPYLLKLKGTHWQIGYDYASLLAQPTSFTYNAFLNKVTDNNATIIAAVTKFNDFLWTAYYEVHIPQGFLSELAGMEAWWNGATPAQRDKIVTPPQVVSKQFYVLANMPADFVNVVSALEEEFEQGWPDWLKTIVNDIIWFLEHYHGHSCDSYGVWGSRTVSSRLYTSRNLDYNSDTGINKYKLVTIYEIIESSGVKKIPYATMGFSFGLGALAGMNAAGISTSEMNLDNSNITFSGLPFPLRLRFLLEQATNLKEAMTIWNSTNNTNSFNFLIGSSADGQAFALETMQGFTAQFPANSPIEAAATYYCNGTDCHRWTNETGYVKIGKPIPEAVWRTNHGMNPLIMSTQEPLFNDTVFRYDLMHELFIGFQQDKILINDTQAVEIVATLGTKGSNFLTCEQVLDGSNVLSVAYVPG